MAIKKILSKNSDKVIEVLSQYYKSCNFYIQLSNAQDASTYYKETIGPIIKDIIPYGYSYYSLVACDITMLIDSDRELYDRVFKGAEYNHKIISREQKHVMFILCAGCEKGSFDTNSYNMIKEFAQKYDNEYVIITDCPNDYDEPLFATNSGFTKMTHNGVPIFRYNRR